MPMCGRHEFGEGRLGVGGGNIQHPGGPLGELGFVLPGFGPADPGVRHDLVEPHLDEGRPGGPHRVVVAIALFAGDDKLAPSGAECR